MRGRLHAVDVALAGAATAMNVAGALVPDEQVSYRFADGGLPALMLSAGAGLALLWRRSLPLPSFLVVSSCTFLVHGLTWPVGNLPITLMLSAYALGAYSPVRWGLAGLAAAFASVAVMFSISAPYFDSPLGAAAPVQLLLAWGLGVAVSRRRRAADQAQARTATLEREAAAQAERARREERLRVARDLHDSVTNTLTAITVQAAVARRSATTAAPALEAIEGASRAATEDLRRMLGALRAPAGALPPRDEGERALEAALLRSTGWHPDLRLTSRTPGAAPIGWPVDISFGLCVVALNVTGSVVPDTSTQVEYDAPVLPALVVLASAPGLALMLRRRHPVAVLATVLVALSTVSWLGWQTGNLPGSLLLATYALGAWAPARRGALALAMMAAGMAVVGALDLPHFDEWVTWVSPFVFAVPWVFGVAVRRRRLADERTLEEALVAERQHGEAAERARAEERAAVARELHDLVAHGVAAVAVQAAAGRARASREAAEALAMIESASRRALADLRTMLLALRSEEAAPRSPAPGLGEIEELVDAHRATHGPVLLTVDAAVADEPQSLRLAAYRLVQEALTNVAKHATGSAATVHVRSTGAGLSVLVEDDGPAADPLAAAAAPGGGHGLVGMQERVALFGGVLTTGHAGRGFRVRAELPRRAAR